ncbi:hypothetical protein NC661_06535 [Aquibacillus koreensis]|uniref:Uncharacterized protein n=1 Tax=Aquibacillus koreensis TaxID=279446 RepID=A0A9X4AJ67_9BACI|nr:hypothetical protein [Aquibacillus koreensis]MCT2535692.1 hypothetical protein [Aquibacillus koreensis]MDC3420023.1 hypothetical protein [Aquibacillus koreensis]
MSNNWYELVNDDSLEQGDIFKEVNVVIPTTELLNGDSDTIDVIAYDVIILTQSCDLDNSKTPWVQVTPITPLSEMQKISEVFGHKKPLESLRRGHEAKYHLINECTISGYEEEICLVDFRNVFTVPFNYIKDKASIGNNRLRLKSPYKEHLSQAYAKFFMRVGLPSDIPSFR